MKSCYEVFDSPGRDFENVFLQAPHRKKNIGFRSGDWGSHAFDLPRPLHLPGYASFNDCRKSFRQRAGAQSCWNHKFCRAETFSSSRGWIVSRKLRCRWSANLYGSKQGQRQCPLQYQTKSWRWSGLDTRVHLDNKDCPVPRCNCCGRWTHPRIKHASYVQSLLC